MGTGAGDGAAEGGGEEEEVIGGWIGLFGGRWFEKSGNELEWVGNNEIDKGASRLGGVLWRCIGK